jgi:hypothetical protein
MMPIAPNTQHFKNHFLKTFQEKNSIMYKKSVNAGSQSDISRRGSSLADMNGNGHDSEVTEALNVNIVTNNCESTENVRRHRGTCHSANDKAQHEVNGKPCLHNSKVVRFKIKMIYSMSFFQLETTG